MSGKEFKQHFKEVCKTPKYASADAVPTTADGEPIFSKEYTLEGTSKKEISAKVNLILKNSLGGYLDDYIVKDKTDNADIKTEVTGHYTFDYHLGASFFNRYFMKYNIITSATDGKLKVVVTNFSCACQTLGDGVGGTGDGEYASMAAINSTKYAVDKKFTKVRTFYWGYLRVAAIDLSDIVFNAFNEKILLPIEKLNSQSESW